MYVSQTFYFWQPVAVGIENHTRFWDPSVFIKHTFFEVNRTDIQKILNNNAGLKKLENNILF